MPTATFNNLPEEKREAILDAARREFSRVDFEEASINKIIADADISRGSFYMYFESKKDLALTLFREYGAQMADGAGRVLRDTNGDIFAVFESMFDETMRYGAREKQNFQAMKNMFASMRGSEFHSKGSVNMREMFVSHDKRMPEEVEALINRKELKLESQEELEDLLVLLFSVTRHAITHAFMHPEGLEISRARFIHTLNMVKYGVIKT